MIHILFYRIEQENIMGKNLTMEKIDNHEISGGGVLPFLCGWSHCLRCWPHSILVIQRFKAPGNKNLVSLDILAVPWSFDISPFIGSWKLIAFMINTSQCISWPEHLLTKVRWIFISFGLMLYFHKHIWDYKICLLQTENSMKQNWISEVEILGGPCSRDISNFVWP